ncbi:MAG: DUF3343 domain-containing protein [Syntrophothermus sp.]|uniref:DUF3343 domain-containing protein n=1 Tax=Syntrophothermus sp. TaxID=2736299 RepID=UPI00257F2FE2|nr:DUF3343 domain-containing protein [Syntrophothermus sp.]NSW81719.1 DUF3343 domain-containing protein [Syntrophothermus sp.]
MEEVDWYVLFPNHHEGLRLYRKLQVHGISCTIAPTPRAVSSCCGISLVVPAEAVDEVKAVAETVQVKVEGIVPVAKRKQWKYRSS